MSIDPPDALLILVRRAQDGVPGSLTELRAELPGLMPWADLERLAREAREAWAAAAGEGVDGTAAKLRALDRAAAALARPGAGPLEVLLAGRAALAAAVLEHALREVGESTSTSVRRTLVRRASKAGREFAAARRALAAVQERLGAGPGHPESRAHDGG